MRYTEIQIIEGLRVDDDKVLEFFSRDYREKVRRYIRNRGGTLEDANEVFNDSLIKLIKAIKKPGKIINSLEDYFFIIYRNEWINMTRLNSKNLNYTKVADDILDSLDDYENYKQDQICKLIWENIESMSQSCNNILEMFYRKNLSFREIAETLGYSTESSAKQRKYRCIMILKERIKQDPNYTKILNDE